MRRSFVVYAIGRVGEVPYRVATLAGSSVMARKAIRQLRYRLFIKFLYSKKKLLTFIYVKNCKLRPPTCKYSSNISNSHKSCHHNNHITNIFMLETLHYMSSVQRLFEHPEKKSELDEKWGLVKVTTKGSTGKFTLENITSLYVVCGQPS